MMNTYRIRVRSGGEKLFPSRKFPMSKQKQRGAEWNQQSGPVVDMRKIWISAHHDLFGDLTASPYNTLLWQGGCWQSSEVHHSGATSDVASQPRGLANLITFPIPSPGACWLANMQNIAAFNHEFSISTTKNPKISAEWSGCSRLS